jgi:hypothetical protein
VNNSISEIPKPPQSKQLTVVSDDEEEMDSVALEFVDDLFREAPKKLAQLENQKNPSSALTVPVARTSLKR